MSVTKKTVRPVDGTNATMGAATRREIKDRLRNEAKIDVRAGLGGGGIAETRKIRRDLATDYAQNKNYDFKQLLPAKGMTYLNKSALRARCGSQYAGQSSQCAEGSLIAGFVCLQWVAAVLSFSDTRQGRSFRSYVRDGRAAACLIYSAFAQSTVSTAT